MQCHKYECENELLAAILLFFFFNLRFAWYISGASCTALYQDYFEAA